MLNEKEKQSKKVEGGRKQVARKRKRFWEFKNRKVVWSRKKMRWNKFLEEGFKKESREQSWEKLKVKFAFRMGKVHG